MSRLLCFVLLLCPALLAAADLDEAELDRRIDQLHKGDFVVKLTDAAGKPIAGDVKYEMTRQAFPFGTAVSADFVTHPTSANDLQQYGDIVSRYFNYAVEEHYMKWVPMEPVRGKVDDKMPLAIWDWCQARGIPMRGHCIFWALDKWVPEWLKPLDATEVEVEMKQRIEHMTKLFAGKITEWDLNNEMLHGDWYDKKLGLKNGADYFKWAKAIAPNDVFCINDYGPLQARRIDDFVQHVRAMQQDGAPIGGVNDQAHFVGPINKTNRELFDVLDKLGSLGVPVKVTEFDIKTSDEKRQAEDTRRFYKVCFAHPAVKGIFMWGFWEGRHWRPEAALWRKDWTIKPNGQAYVKLMDEWKSRGTAHVTDGTLKFHGFFGEYRIHAGDRTWTVHLPDARPADAVTIQ